MRKTHSILLTIASALCWAAIPTQTLALDDAAPTPAAHKPAAHTAHRRTVSKPAEKNPKDAALPCARAQWKHDPVCFGANDGGDLPVPDARSGEKGEHHSGDISIEPKVGVNQLAKQPVYINSPNPNPSGTQFGGGLGLKLPF